MYCTIHIAGILINQSTSSWGFAGILGRTGRVPGSLLLAFLGGDKTGERVIKRGGWPPPLLVRNRLLHEVIDQLHCCKHEL